MGVIFKMIYVKKKRKRKITDRIFFYLVFFVIIIYMIGYCTRFFSRKKIDTTLVKFVDFDKSKIFDGIIIRNEKVYKAKKNGLIYFVLHNNDYAKKNSLVCVIEDKKANDDLMDELSQVNNNIIDVQKKRIDMSIFKNDIKKANDNLKDIVDKNMFVLSQAKNNKKINGVLDLIEKNLEIRNQILLTENRGEIKEMDDEKNELEKKIKNNICNLNSEDAGLVSYFIDGLENNFLLDKLESLTFENINIKAQAKEINNNSFVNAGENIFKIIEDNNWYIACRIKNKYIKDLKENDWKIIYLKQDNNFVEVEFMVYKILAKNKSESILILKSDKFMHDFVDVRNIKFKLEDNKKHGYKILNKSIVAKNLFKIEKEFVYKDEFYYVIKKAGENNKVKVKIYDEDENYFYVESDEVKIKDVLVKENDKKDKFVINDVKKIRGVYLANNGIAEFKKINFDGDLKNDFVVLDEKLNPEIKIYDMIVLNAENIIDGEKIMD